MNDLKEIRDEIDKVDSNLISLLEDRFILVKQTITFKEKMEDLPREQEVLNNIANALKNQEHLDTYKSVYKSLFLEAKQLK